MTDLRTPTDPRAPRFGLLLSSGRSTGQSDAAVFARTLALAEEARSLGLDDLWVTEHHFSRTTLAPSALALAAFLLGRCPRIRVGTAVTLLPLHPPVHVAEQAALLDQLSGGRFTLGVGRGAPTTAYEVFARDRERPDLGDCLDRIRSAWRSGSRPAGAVHPADRVTPAPLTSGGPPLYVAAGSPGTITVAGARGLPIMMLFDKTPEAKAEMVALHARAAAAAGRAAHGHDHAFSLLVHVTDSPRRARELMHDRARRLVGAHTPSGTDGGPERIEETVRRTAERLLAHQAVGDVDTCVRRLLGHIRTSGCGRVLCQVEAADDDAATVRRLRRLATEVLPRVRRALVRNAPDTAPADGWMERAGRRRSAGDVSQD
ncbi:LLM class flavin-dependent oxidoreductase [Streptomyces sp. NPDC005955]|uniref:LLM class flavin-dependent oxidoreductase n=1 Tax=Streptomyces sp. NPDC005955 TaxID=3364738 RepID=UPI0036AEFCA6